MEEKRKPNGCLTGIVVMTCPKVGGFANVSKGNIDNMSFAIDIIEHEGGRKNEVDV